VINPKQVVEWTTYAHRRRMTEGVDGPWWELIPDDQKPMAKLWAEQLKENAVRRFDKKWLTN